MSEMKIPTMTGEQAKQQRLKLGMNQTDYWGRVLVTQSASSRYESGRPIPKPVQALMHIAYGTPLQCEKMVQQVRGAK